MADIPSGIIVLWPGANGGWPSGWSRVTALDGKFAKGTTGSPAPTGTGGSSTHTHSTPAHSHTLASHNHTASFGPAPGYPNYWPLQSPGPSGTKTINRNHSHSGTTSSVSGNTSGSASGSWSTVTNLPINYTMIAIQSDGTPTGFPDDSVVYFNGGVPTDWTHHAGSASRFIVGAGGGAGGGTAAGGGAHSHSGGSHTHSGAGSHNHSGGTVTGPTPASSAMWCGCCGYQGLSQHSHTWNANAGGGGTAGGTSSANTGSHTYQPPFTYLRAVQNTSGADNWLEEAIVLWVGSIANIPEDWTLCNGGNNDSGNATPSLNGRFIFTTNSGGTSLNGTGGTAGHDHTDPATHTHTQAHTHTTTNTSDAGSGSGNYNPDWTSVNEGKPHWHSAVTTSSNGTAYAAAAHTVDADSNNEPDYYLVAYLSAPEEPSSGGNTALFGTNF